MHLATPYAQLLEVVRTSDLDDVGDESLPLALLGLTKV
jgi:hypothetical protein